MKKWVVPAAAVVVLAACGNDELDPEVNNEEGADVPAEEPEAADVDYPLTVTDALGEEMTIEADPETVVSFAPSNTETIYALDEGDALVGRALYDSYPEEVEEVEPVTTEAFETDVEAVVELDPDLVLSHETFASDGRDQLRDAGIPVYVVPEATSIEETYEVIHEIAELLDRPSEAEAIVADMQEQFASLSETAGEISDGDVKSVLYEVGDMFVAADGSFIDELLEHIGAENAAGNVESEMDFAQIDEENVVNADPEVIVTTASADDIMERTTLEYVRAVAEEDVYEVEDPDVLSRTGPRLAEGAEELARLIYPEEFAE
ncbi:ABC transporter substrate-binding protein [Shouchella shacheensis]|uniref:ABC transporter substrate-binding protein n=1 Tax=Shouchella shacheensis TaxID=1649580 RepID=UPI00073FD0F8|nr:helical backbone metal receptor [Shouchella shacheensis]